MKLKNDTADEARANIYNFLAKVFSSNPTPDSVRGVRQMAEALEIACPDDLSLAELEQEYMELFIVPNPRYVAPYESVFRDRQPLPAVLKRGSDPSEATHTVKGLLMGESTLAVWQCYLDAGISPAQELPDHIANELCFMAYLWTRQAQSSPVKAKSLAKLRADFRREHILKWIDQLRERVAESDRLGYYPAALHVAEVVLQNDL